MIGVREEIKIRSFSGQQVEIENVSAWCLLTHLVKPADYTRVFLHSLPSARSVGKTANPKPVRPTYLDTHAAQCYYTRKHIAHKLRDVQLQQDRQQDRQAVFQSHR